MKRFFFKIAYNGSSYAGWQIQPNASTIQAEIQDILSKLYGFDVSIMGCGRTDSGVSASDYYFHVDLPLEKYEFNILLYKLNRMSTPGIAFKEIYMVDDNAHARFDAFERKYIYYCSLNKNPFKKQYQIPDRRKFDFDRLQEAANVIKQYGSFFPFCKSNSDVKSYDCIIKESKWISDSKGNFEYHISANRFLRGMVRLIVGMCFQYMNYKIELTEVHAALKNQVRLSKDLSAPPDGLFLVDIKYPFEL